MPAIKLAYKLTVCSSASILYATKVIRVFLNKLSLSAPKNCVTNKGKNLFDSRSFLSYPRHEYFRRILCNHFGNLIENGEYPANIEFVGQIVRNICFNNAVEYFGVDA